MIIVRKSAPGISVGTLAPFLRRASAAVGLPAGINVVLASSRDLRSLNRRFRGQDKATDVLSFPPFALPQGPRRRRSAGRRLSATRHVFSGDIIISSEIAARNARRYGHSPTQELKILILHGILHLAGYDHETDRGAMARREEALRHSLGLTSDGLIGRARTLKPMAARQRPNANPQRPAASRRRSP